MKDNGIVFCTGGGCTAKLGPAALQSVLARIPKTYDENLLVGFETSDDAAVYKISNDLAIVQTLDFFRLWWKILTCSGNRGRECAERYILPWAAM